MTATAAVPGQRGHGHADDLNFADFLRQRADTNADRLALIHPAGAMNYAELDEIVWQAAAHLAHSGVMPGDVVTAVFDAELSILIVTLASLRLGATIFSQPRGFPPASWIAELRRAGVNWLIGSRPLSPPDDIREIVFDPSNPAAMAACGDRSIRASDPAAPAVLVAGSGSTGRSKLLAVGHRAYLQRLGRTFIRIPVEPDDRVFSQVHFDYDAGRRTVLATLYHGGVAVLVRRQGETLVGICEKSAITVVWTAVADLELALDQIPPNAPVPVLPGLRELYVGTATVSESLRNRTIRQLTGRLHIRYGINECGPVAIATPEQIRSVPGVIGRPLPAMQIGLFDDGNRPVAPGTVGEIRIRGPGLFDRYVDDPQAMERAFHDGWFRSGDLGRWSGDGLLIHCGRGDDMMIVAGINVYPAEIEQALGKHPAVREVAAFPVPGRNGQEVPVSAVALHPRMQADAEDLLTFGRERLGARAPRFIALFESLPRTTQGKVDRRSLREHVTRLLAQRRGSSGTSHRPAGSAPAAVGHVQIGFRAPPPESDERLRSWFADWLQAGPVGAAVAVAAPNRRPDAFSPVSACARHFLLHALALMTRLLQSGGVPVFDPASIEAFAPRPDKDGRWRAALALPRVERMDPQTSELALRAALDACSKMAAMPLADDSKKELILMFDQVIGRIRSVVPRGKSTIPLLRAAHALDIPFVHLWNGVYQIGWGSRGVRTSRSATACDSANGARVAQSKAGTAVVLHAAGLPVPVHGLAHSPEQALTLARRIGWPLVVKPDGADRGEGVTVDVRDEKHLVDAFETARAAAAGNPVLVERQVAGVCHRLFIARGKLLYAVRRLPKSVIGDGRSSVAELIRQANQRESAAPPWMRTEPFPEDEAARAAIGAAGFTMESVPAPDVPVPLRRIESTADGGFDQEVTNRMHPVNVDAALRATALLDLDVAGVDIISSDISAPWFENGAVINEVNFAPLLGGGEISRRYIPEYLARIVDDGGRIDIEVIIDGSASLSAARQRQQSLLDRGLRCWLTSARRTVGPDGSERSLPFATLVERFHALILDRSVDALVLAAGSEAELRDLPGSVAARTGSMVAAG